MFITLLCVGLVLSCANQFNPVQTYQSEDVNIEKAADTVDGSNPAPERDDTGYVSSPQLYGYYRSEYGGYFVTHIRYDEDWGYNNYSTRYYSVNIPAVSRIYNTENSTWYNSQNIIGIGTNCGASVLDCYAQDEWTPWCVRRIILPASLKRIEANAFTGRTFGNHDNSNDWIQATYDLSACVNLEYIGNNAFGGGGNGKIVKIAENLTKLKTIGDGAFKNVIQVSYDENESLKLPAVTSIGDNAFENCTGLKAVQLNQNSTLTKIGASAFRNCIAMEDIFIPSSVTTLGSYAFADCLNLTDVISETNILSAHIFENDSSLTSLALATTVTTVPAYAFNGCTKFADSEQFPNVTSIGDYAFYKVTFYSFDLKKCTSVGECAFSGTTIRSIDLKNVQTIGDSAFAECVHLETVSIPGTITSVGEKVFDKCEELTTVTFGKDLFNKYMFQGCERLTSVTFNNGSTITAIPDYMFNECEIKEIKTGAAIVNPASWKIMEKFGFEKLDTTKMVQYTYLDEPTEDYQYRLTREMYLENNKNKSLKIS